MSAKGALKSHIEVQSFVYKAMYNIFIVYKFIIIYHFLYFETSQT